MLSRLNNWLATRVTNGVATMGCVWLFLVWSLLPILWPASQSAVFYVSGGVLQLVLLPLIMVGQAKLSAAAETRAAVQFAAVMEMLGDVREDHARLIETLTKEDGIMATLADVQAALSALDTAVQAAVAELATLAAAAKNAVDPAALDVVVADINARAAALTAAAQPAA